MNETKEQVLTFLSKCDELKKCKFIMATTKIKDLLKCIVNCPELYNLFEAVTKNFNYPLVKAQCLVTVKDGFNRSYVVLPQTVGHRLAFIFCLLVEFDKDTLNINAFLQRYFSEDGSYFASYQAFCNLVIKGLEDALMQVFKEELSSPDEEEEINPEVLAALEAIGLAIYEERQFLIKNTNVPLNAKEGGLAILDELNAAVRTGNESLLNALLCGYHYFCMYYNCVSDGVSSLIKEIAEFGQHI